MNQRLNGTLVIAGGGHAAAELATAARQEGWAGRIVMAGEEVQPPYQRPPLSKAFLAGEVELQGLALRPCAAYAKAGVELLTSTRIVELDRANQRVRCAEGRLLAYDKLALTLGGRSKRLSAELAAKVESAGNVCYLRTVVDAERMRARFARGARLAIIGGGYIGLEVAAVAIRHGLEVTVLEALPRVLARVVAPEVSTFFQDIHRAAGVELRTDAEIAQFELDPSENAVRAVVCGDGSRVPVDLVVVAVGMQPNTELAAAAGVDVDDGILVDEACRTSAADIVAAGDCARQMNPYAGRSVRIESLPNALEQARTAAATLCGKTRTQNFVPWFWSEQYDMKLQIVGLSQDYEQVVLRGSRADRSFAAFYLKQHRIIAVDGVNRPQDFMIAKRLVADRVSLDAEYLGDESMALKSFLPA